MPKGIFVVIDTLEFHCSFVVTMAATPKGAISYYTHDQVNVSILGSVPEGGDPHRTLWGVHLRVPLPYTNPMTCSEF